MFNNIQNMKLSVMLCCERHKLIGVGVYNYCIPAVLFFVRVVDKLLIYNEP